MQSISIGCTDYSIQSLEDIKSDIRKWISFVDEDIPVFQDVMVELDNNGFWKPCCFDFHSYCNSLKTIYTTIQTDLERVIRDIESNNITNVTVKLLNNVGNVGSNQYTFSGEAFHSNEDVWHDYGSKLFKKAEKELYARSKDFFGTLIDASNAAERLRDFMKEQTVIDNSIHAENSVIIGDGNSIKKSEIATTNESGNVKNSVTIGNNNSIKKTSIATEKKAKKNFWLWLLEHFWLPITVAVVAGIIVWFLTN